MNTVRCPLQSGDEGATLLSYLDRQLDPDTVLAFERHLSVCSECTRVVAAQRAVWKALEQWEPIAVSADFDERMMARIAAEQRPWWRRVLEFPVSGSGGWWKPAMPLAAACLALVAVSVWRGPLAPVPVAMDSAEVQQVEDVLADVDMLQQLGITEPAASSNRQTL